MNSKKIIVPLVVLLVVLGGWELAVRKLQVPHYVLPAPSRIAEALLDSRTQLLPNTAVTLGESVFGFIVGSLLGLGLGIVR